MVSSKSKSLLDKIILAITALKNHKGSSVPAIAKYLRNEFDLEIDTTRTKTALKQALKKGVTTGHLLKVGMSYKLVGVEIEEPVGERLTIGWDIVGKGDEAVDGSTVVVSYVGRLEETKDIFDQAKRFSFTIGEGTVIKGWDKGVKGMKKGGSRLLICPPALGYGKRGSPPEIPPNATLNFEITLHDVK
jgi:hypothetical protein